MKNVAVIFLDYGERRSHTAEAIKSVDKAGYPYDLKIVDKKGIAAAINEGLHEMPDYDYYAICANDIVLPQDWLKEMVEAAERIPNTGIVGIHCVEWLPEVDVNGVRPTWCPFGDWLITKELFETIGYFNEAHDPYGMQDSDYGYRATSAGFYNYYLNNLRSTHIGHDCGEQTEYRKMKDEGLNVALDTYNRLVNHYDATGNYYVSYGKA